MVKRPCEQTRCSRREAHPSQNTLNEHATKMNYDDDILLLPASAPSASNRLKEHVIAMLQTVMPALVIALVIHLFVVQAMRVNGQSMEPNLHTGQRLIVEKISYLLHAPRRGDIVVVQMPAQNDELLVKRVVALAGEVVEIKNGQVYVDGVRLAEPYLPSETPGNQRWVVGPLQTFVMGDNRSASKDSRTFGPVQLSHIVGHALFSYWPLNQLGNLE